MKLNVYRLVNRLFTGNFIDFNCLNKNINPPHQCSTNRRNSFQICPFLSSNTWNTNHYHCLYRPNNEIALWYSIIQKLKSKNQFWQPNVPQQKTSIVLFFEKLCLQILAINTHQKSRAGLFRVNRHIYTKGIPKIWFLDK